MVSSVRRRIFAGNRIRDMRKRLGVAQATMAERLGISVSYLSQIENDDRPVTPQVLIELARAFPLEWADVDPDDDNALLIDAVEAAIDPTVPSDALAEEAVRRSLRQQPLLARRMVALHAAYRRSQEQLRAVDDRIDSGSIEAGRLPWEEVRDWFHAEGNYIDAIDRRAEMLADALGLGETPAAGLRARLEEAHGVTIEAGRGEGKELRSYDPDLRRLTIDRSLPPESVAFLLAHELMRLEAAETIDRIARDARFLSDASTRILRVGLANYAAGALLMPYASFRQAARETRHDIDQLRQRFGVSFEQACHRLSTLQRPGQQGVPFFFCRIDMAGNITKRHSATRLQFARFGGACPLWIVHEAVAIPDRILVQLAETPDGTRYVSMAKGLVKQTGSYLRPARRYAVALGCEVGHAADFVYGDHLDLHGSHSATPIGTSCRICPREDCDQRAFPPTGRVLEVDPDRRSVVPYGFR
ncbi:helix-turn-helix domain-containing protein [Sphingomonas sp. ID0503]|uniref:helix-turn-helix domain-containing protein n=1 Tax=Sphingomonas sp. ID0503 TaxID=3399691 RepID=UPI003AFA7BCD